MEAIKEVLFAARDFVHGYSHRQQFEYLRVLHFDVSRAEYYFLCLGDGKSLPEREFNVEHWKQDEVTEAKATGALQLVDDCLRAQFVNKSQIERLPGVRRSMEYRQREMTEMLATADPAGPRQLNDIYADPSLLDGMCERMAAKGRRKREWYRTMFLRWVALGSDEHALAPSPPGPARGTTRIGKKGRKTGPKTFKFKNGVLEEVETPKMSPYWRRILRKAVERFYVSRSKTPFPWVYRQMVDELCLQKTIVNGKEVLARIREDKIPPYCKCYKHFIKIAISLGKDVEKPLRRKPVGERGGKSTDIALGTELCDVDASYFEDFEIAYSAKGKTVRIPCPVVLYLISRISGAILSWFVSLGRETARMYRFLFWYAAEDKNERLNELQYDGDRSGLVYGEIDGICGDHGPLKKSDLIKILTDAGLDVAFPLPGTPRGKGNIEGHFGVVKRAFRKIIKDSKEIGAGIVSIDNPKGGGRKRRRGRRILCTIDAFERIIIEQVNAMNKLSLRRHHVPREMVDEKFRTSSPAKIFEWHQGVRNGDGSQPLDKQANAFRFLERESGTCLRGLVKALGGEYGSESLRIFEDKVRLANALPANKRIPITYVVPPWGGVIYWEKSKNEFVELTPTEQTTRNFGEKEQYALISFRNMFHASTDGRRDVGENASDVVRNRMEVEISNSRRAFEGSAYKSAPVASKRAVKAAQQEVEKRALKEMATKAGLGSGVVASNKKGESVLLNVVNKEDDEDEAPGAWMNRSASGDDAE